MNHLKDTFKHKGMRKNLIAQLKEKGIENELILNAFDTIPRHYFLDLAFEEQAYSNMAFQIGSGQTISHPFTVAFQSELLEIEKGEKILEIGTGSGFQTCLLCALGGKVFSIERHRELHMKAKQIIHFFNFNPKLFFGDGYQGNQSYAPYDKILVTCGAPEIPSQLIKQLKIGGIMVIPVGEGIEQKMLKIKKIKEDEYIVREYGTFKFVPMLERTVK
jgi:protein-L-isoaspartate(D-aspartate) O-methyltransferase